MAMPDHLGKFWRPARLLPWKRVTWATPDRSADRMWRQNLAVSHVPLPMPFVLPTPEAADSELRAEFPWDGKYPDRRWVAGGRGE